MQDPLNYDLVFRVAAVSRCYRAETSNLELESGIYRVHQFTKVTIYMAEFQLKVINFKRKSASKYEFNRQFIISFLLYFELRQLTI